MSVSTGPFTSVYDNPFTGVYIRRSTWKSVPVDKSKPLTFIYQSGKTDRPDITSATSGNAAFAGGNFDLVELEADVFDSVIGSLRDGSNRAQAQIGVSIAEGRESLGIIQKRGLQAFRMISALKSVNPGLILSVFNEIARDMGMLPCKRWDVFRKKYRRPCRYSKYRSRRTARGRRREWLNPVKGSAAAWLEYWLVWAPMVGDIKTAQKALEKDADYSSTTKSTAKQRIQGVTPWVSWSRTCTGKFVYTLRVANPNVDLANRLGLVNVASIAWELVPLSFVVNYFVDIGRWLGSFTDLAGMSLESSYYTTFAKGEQQEKRTIISGGVQSEVWIKFEGVGVIRSVGYSPSQGGFSHYAAPHYGITSITRAATSVSLLISSIRNS